MAHLLHINSFYSLHHKHDTVAFEGLRLQLLLLNIISDSVEEQYCLHSNKGIPLTTHIRKPAFCICKNKGTDQLLANCTADQCLCFCYKVSTILLLICTTADDCYRPEISDLRRRIVKSM